MCEVKLSLLRPKRWIWMPPSSSDRAHLWNYDAKLNHVRGQSSKAAPKFNVLAVELIVWPRTSMELWCKMKSCARSEFEGNVETNVLALEVMAGPRTSLKLWCMCAVRDWWALRVDLALELMAWPRTSLILWCKIGSCARSEFKGNAEIHCFGPRCDGLTAHIVKIIKRNWIMCAVRARRRHRNSMFWQ